MKYIIDAGVENIRIAYFSKRNGGYVLKKDVLCTADDRIQEVLKRSGLFQDDGRGLLDCDGDLYITGKLSEIVKNAFGCGITIMSSAALWAGARWLLKENTHRDFNSLGIVDASASGYMVIRIDNKGDLIKDSLVVNPKCGAGSGINLNRILEKLNIKRDSVDEVLREYLDDAGREKRRAVPVRADRCGVFSSSATISDKNQGIPLDYALAVTMKSEVLKACKKMERTDLVCLTGRIFSWQYARDCAADYFSDIGAAHIEYDKDQMLLIRGINYLTEKIGKDNFKARNKIRLRKAETLLEYPSFIELKDRYEKSGIYRRVSSVADFTHNLNGLSLDIGLDVGSTMAKMALADSSNNALLYINSYNNHGDTIETVKYMLRDLKRIGGCNLKIQNIGITGSGRYQVEKSIQAVYPHLAGRIFTLVENYAHARGSIDLARDYIRELKEKGVNLDGDFYVLVDIGGEDTKISVVSLKRNELFDNAMNIKCSAGTGSLMDTLSALFGIGDIAEACMEAYNAPKAYDINATCAVFLMENARKMQAEGFQKNEILASCNYSIVENMARTLWNQIEFPKNPLVLLHGQTMLSDPLPLAVTRRVQEYTGAKTYCLVPPMPGHRACIGLLRSIEKNRKDTDAFSNLDDYINREYEKKIIVCKGAACGDAGARCSRTRLISKGDAPEIRLTLGGCTAVNELQPGIRAGRKVFPDAYREIWNYVAEKLPRSETASRLVIPRSYAVSEQAYFFAKIFEHLGFDVHCDDVNEQDILDAQPLFAIDTCAPNIGASGQLMRLAGEKHGFILVPQIDYLPTGGTSLGRTCTSNQGGIVIAMHFARMKHPESRFLFFNISLKKIEPGYITDQVFGELEPLFQFYKRSISKNEFFKAVEKAYADNRHLIEELSNKAADFIEEAIKNKLNISIVCGREYILNPGIYDSHIGKLLRDKNVVAIPSYAVEADLDKNYSYMYWKNPHDILSKVDAIANKRLHEIVTNERLGDQIRKIERGLTDTLLSVVQISTFRCGPDSVTVPAAAEVTKRIPSLFIQSDAMIKELAHLENRVNTHLNQLTKHLHEEISGFESKNFKIEVLNEFVFDGINRETDVIYIPTLNDNRVVSTVMRAAGIAAIDNYEDETYDLSLKVKTGRKFAGDSVCVPLSAVFADMLLAVNDFLERKKNNDPLVCGKNRILVFMNGGDGPCRLGQYVDVLKLLLYRQFRSAGKGDNDPLAKYSIKILINLTSSLSSDKVSYLEEWAGVEGLQAVIIQAVLHSVFMKAASLCMDNEEYSSLVSDFYKLKRDVYYILENKIKPGQFTVNLIKLIKRRAPKLAGIAKYFGYGLYRNNGLRRIFKRFGKKWIRPPGDDKVRVYVDGEVYVRVAQIEEIFKIIADELGFGSFELNHTPVWCFLEYILENRILVADDEIKTSREALDRTGSGDEKTRLNEYIESRKKVIRDNKNSVSSLRNILAKPLYKAARIDIPHPMSEILKEARKVLPSLKPHGELAPYIGEAIIRLRSGTDLFLNAAPEGCMVSSMGEILTPKIMEAAGNPRGRIQHLFSTNGEIDKELLFTALLKQLGPERYYRKKT